MENNGKSLSMFWIIIVILIGLVIAGIFFLSRKGTPNTNDPYAITASDHAIGPETAAITILEYSDFQCPACKNFYPQLKQLSEDFPEDVRVIYRHFPLTSIHPFALSAAKASEAAAQQGQFWAMHDMLFNNQFEWSNDQKPEELFASYADTLGLNVNEFKSAMKSNTVKRKVNGDRAIGLRKNLRGTPSIFINGAKSNGFNSYAEMKSYIQNEITKLTGKTFDAPSEESESESSDKNDNDSEDSKKTSDKESTDNKTTENNETNAPESTDESTKE